jgi:hypothetical protein
MEMALFWAWAETTDVHQMIKKDCRGRHRMASIKKEFSEKIIYHKDLCISNHPKMTKSIHPTKLKGLPLNLVSKPWKNSAGCGELISALQL